MDDILYRKAAENLAGEAVSIEMDGTVWVDSDNRYLDNKEIATAYKRLQDDEAAAKEAAIAHAKSLGFTDDMIAVMYPNLRSELPTTP